MILIGIDPGTARMGCAIIDFKNDGVTSLVASEVITTSSELEMPSRLKILYNRLAEIISLHKPDSMVIERLFFNTNAKTAINVGQARGISMLAAAHNDLNVFEYTALEAKLVLTGYGRSDKKVMQEAVKDILGLDNIIKSDDANDAVAMALCHLKKLSSKS